MAEDLEQQKRADDEAKRQIRDQELARILAMGKEERGEMTEQCIEEEREKRSGASFGDMPLLVFDVRNPSDSEIGGGQRYTLKKY